MRAWREREREGKGGEVRVGGVFVLCSRFKILVWSWD